MKKKKYRLLDLSSFGCGVLVFSGWKKAGSQILHNYYCLHLSKRGNLCYLRFLSRDLKFYMHPNRTNVEKEKSWKKKKLKEEEEEEDEDDGDDDGDDDDGDGDDDGDERIITI